MNRKNHLQDEAGPIPVQGGIDDGLEWEEIMIGPGTHPESVARMLRESFNDQWIKDFLKAMGECK